MLNEYILNVMLQLQRSIGGTKNPQERQGHVDLSEERKRDTEKESEDKVATVSA